MQHRMCQFFTLGVSDDLHWTPCEAGGDKRCTWKINLRRREPGERRHFLINDIGWCFIKTVEETIHFAWTLPLTNHHWSIFIENCYFADSSWAVITPAGCCLLVVPLLPLRRTVCWFWGMLSGHRCKQARSSALYITFSLLPFAPRNYPSAVIYCIILLCSCIYHKPRKEVSSDFS